MKTNCPNCEAEMEEGKDCPKCEHTETSRQEYGHEIHCSCTYCTSQRILNEIKDDSK